MYEIYRSAKNRQAYFRLKARNGQIILASEGYKTKASCKSGIRSVRANAAREGSFDVKKARNGKFYFTLVARNGEVIGTSQMYKTKDGCKKGIASVVNNAASDDVRDDG